MNAQFTQRHIEWWALLNIFVRPSDLPKEADEREIFRALTHAIPHQRRLDFWNGSFRAGLAREQFR